MYFLRLGLWLLFLVISIEGFPIPDWDPMYLDDDMDFPDILDDVQYELMLMRYRKLVHILTTNNVGDHSVSTEREMLSEVQLCLESATKRETVKMYDVLVSPKPILHRVPETMMSSHLKVEQQPLTVQIKMA
ncbi:hypothetical protein ACLKA6_017937 [Drosophila palustris]